MMSEPPLLLPKTGDNDADRLALMTQVNAVVERWVREHPEQWLWLHRRWPD
jgi:Kdo2-lipid IVA lauroyltransferase/acyltransferase